MNTPVRSMSQDEISRTIDGAAELIQWYGEWPSFHDAELLELVLRRSDQSEIIVEHWRMSTELDAVGYYRLDKHVRVTFILGRVWSLDLAGDDFDKQNVLSGIDVIQTPDRNLLVRFHQSFGIGGVVKSESLSVRFTPLDESAQA